MNQYFLNRYKNFIKAKVNDNYIECNPNCVVWAENIVDGTYYLLLGDCNNNYYGLYDSILIVENCSHPQVINIHNGFYKSNDYIRFKKSKLSNKLSETQFKRLLNSGLYMSLDAGYAEYDNFTTVHRLAVCLYTNILGDEIHHNDKIKSHNWISNLTPVEKKYHDKLDQLQSPNFEFETARLHNTFKQNCHKPKRNNLASRDEIVFEVLVALYNKKSVKEIKKQFKGKIAKSKIYEIKNYFFYLNDFMKELYNSIVLGKATLNGINDRCWNYISDFEYSKEVSNSISDELYEHIYLTLKNIFQNSLLSTRVPYY